MFQMLNLSCDKLFWNTFDFLIVRLTCFIYLLKYILILHFPFKLTHLAIWGSIASWFIFIWAYSNFWPTFPLAADMAGMVSKSWTLLDCLNFFLSAHLYLIYNSKFKYLNLNCTDLIICFLYEVKERISILNLVLVIYMLMIVHIKTNNIK